MPDDETREEPEVEGHGNIPTAAEDAAEGNTPGAHDDSDDVEAHLFAAGNTPGGNTPGGNTPGGNTPG